MDGLHTAGPLQPDPTLPQGEPYRLGPWQGNGPVVQRLRSQDWAATPLGDWATWPTELKTSLGILLGGAVPMVCIWGRDRRVFYNDACTTLGPWQGWPLGQPLREYEPSLWQPLVATTEVVFASGRSQAVPDGPANTALTARYRWTLSPLWQGDQVGGVFATASPIAPACRRAETFGPESSASEPLPEETATLQERAEQFRHLADNIAQLAWMADPSGWIFWYNQRWYDFTGTTLEEMQGWGWQRVHHPDHLERVAEKLRPCLSEGIAWEDSFPLRGKDGQYHWFLSRAMPVRDAQGQVLRWVGTNTDITELRHTEKALAQATDRLNLALRSTTITLFGQNRDLHYTWVYNPIHGYNVDDMIGRRDEDLVSAEAAARLGEVKRQVLTSGVGLRAEVQVDQCYFDLTIDPVRDSQGQIVGITGSAVDVTAQARLSAEYRQTATTLRQSEEQLRLAQHGAGAGLWDWNMLTDEVTWSEEHYELYGLDRSITPSYANWLETVAPVDRDRIHQQIQATIAEGKTLQLEFRIHHPTEGQRWLLVLAQIFHTPAGQPIRMAGIAINITEKKRVELALIDSEARARTQAEEMATLITALKQSESEREQLLQRERTAREEAEQANRLKDQFLAVLSHELRSPLNPILCWSKLLQTRSFDSETTARALASIERNAQIQAQLVNDLLDLARILRGKLHLVPIPVNLAGVIEAAVETVRQAAASKDIALEVDLDPTVRTQGDIARLQQIIGNLLSNAIKFTPNQGQVSVTLRAVEDQAEVTIADTGMGISPDFLPYLFESFRQEDISITRQHGGLGLGLAIVRQLVDIHQGTISAQSPGEGQGATFTLRLPRLKEAAPAVPPPNLAATNTDLAGLRVLAVDDSADTRELLEVLLSEYGATVAVVDSATALLDTIQQQQPDVLISDIGMPDLDGYTLIRRVRALPPDQGGTLPAIALTAYAREEDYQEALTSGYQRHLTKPLDIDKLVRAILDLTRPA
jgi:PAS domain S-box-containing protein